MKLCPKCGESKQEEEFYKYGAASSGRVNVCKECKKIYQRDRGKELRKNPEFLKKERARTREKYKRLGYRFRFKCSPERKAKIINDYFDRYPEKTLARSFSQHVKVSKGNTKHHWSYLPEHAKDIIELSLTEHYKLHRYLIYDQERMMYRATSMVLLDSKERHLDYYNSLKDLE